MSVDASDGAEEWYGPEVVRVLAALDDGDVRPLRALLLSRPNFDERPCAQVWHAVGTLCGRVVGRMMIVQDDCRFDACFSECPPHVTGGGPRRVDDPIAVARELSAALDPLPTAEDHRRAARATFAALETGTLPEWARDPSAALLRHHTDLPVEMLERGPLVDVSAEVAMLAPLLTPLGDASTFRAHLEAGLASSSAARRRLSRRLLILPL